MAVLETKIVLTPTAIGLVGRMRKFTKELERLGASEEIMIAWEITVRDLVNESLGVASEMGSRN